MRLMEKVRSAFAALRAPRTVSEEEDLAAELERLDRETPGWDRDARLAGAESALRRGMSQKTVAAVYGDELAAEARRRLEEAVRPGVYRHFKHGNLYEVYGIAPDAGEKKPGAAPRPPLVFYRQMYEPFGHCYREFDDFVAVVDRRHDFNYQGPRFTFVRPL